MAGLGDHSAGMAVDLSIWRDRLRHARPVGIGEGRPSRCQGPEPAEPMQPRRPRASRWGRAQWSLRRVHRPLARRSGWSRCGTCPCAIHCVRVVSQWHRTI